MSRQTANDLRAARALIQRGWCKGAFARDETGIPVAPNEHHAVQWCSRGAIAAATIRREAEHVAAVDALKMQVGFAIAVWNDARERTQAEVLAAFDRAIQAEEAAE
jgi:hypothetical protein